MRLLRLKLEAFGPFHETELVDFRSLRGTPLFLIHGPVGSGKTFLLDGLCFALFGRSSGGERDRAGLRHVAASEDRETSATVEFECRDESYRVERRFRAEGGEEVTLWRLPPYVEPTQRDVLSSTAGGVEQMLTRLLGLSADQFCQVAILPQGRFRQFLLADGSERRQILSNIFHSQPYLQFQAALRQSADRVREQLESAWAAREELVARYGSSHGDPRESLNRSLEELEAVEARCRQHQDKSAEWERSLEEAVRYEVMERQRDTLARELRVLSEEIDDAEDAVRVRLRQSLPRYLQWRELQAEIETVTGELQEGREQYERLRAGANFLEEEVERARRLEEERFGLQRSIERIESLLGRHEEGEVLAAEIVATSERLRELGRQRAELAALVKEDRARTVQLEGELKRIALAEVKLVKLKAELDAVVRAQGQARRSEMLEESYRQAVGRVERYALLVRELRQERERLRERRLLHREETLEQALARLRERLREGEECPLCGSLSHPRPFQGEVASSPELVPEGQATEEIEHRLEVAERELEQARERKVRLEGRLEERTGESEDPGSALDETTLSALRQTVEAVEGRVSGRDALERELRRLKRSSKPDRSKLKKMRLLKERLESTLETLEARREKVRAGVMGTVEALYPQLSGVRYESLPRHLEGEKAKMEERLAELAEVTFETQRAELMAETFALQLAETRANERRRDDLVERSDRIRRSLEEEFRLDFAGWEDLVFALARTAREVNLASQEAVLDRDTLVRTIKRQLHQSEELLATLPTPEMKAEQIRQVLAREREQLEVDMGIRAALRKAVEHSSVDVERYDALVEEIRRHESRWSNLDRMVRLAEGEIGIDFHDWYLRRVFQKVITAANLRLEVLAPNRFCLGLEDDLAVKVVDFTAAKERPATTLSGGESFLASLALALGLGDVLQSHRSARDRLQTLFIDEGFGYLDRRALEAAMDCLESLKEEGRTVGIISHVPALRERIRAQVVVAPIDSPLPHGGERIQVFSA